MGYLGILAKKPFKNSSRAKGKDGFLTNHGDYQYHHDAVATCSKIVSENLQKSGN